MTTHDQTPPPRTDMNAIEKLIDGFGPDHYPELVATARAELEQMQSAIRDRQQTFEFGADVMNKIVLQRTAHMQPNETALPALMRWINECDQMRDELERVNAALRERYEKAFIEQENKLADLEAQEGAMREWVEREILDDEGSIVFALNHAEWERRNWLDGHKAALLAIKEQFTQAGADLLKRVQALEADKKRLDWLEQKFGHWHQGSVLDRMGDTWRCSSGFHEGDTARKAIDATMLHHEQKKP